MADREFLTDPGFYGPLAPDEIYDPGFYGPAVSGNVDPGFYGPSLGGLVPGFGTPVEQHPDISMLDYGQQALPEDFWSRAAMSGLELSDKPVGRKNTGLNLLASLLRGYARGRIGRAGGDIRRIERENQQAREAARFLALRRDRAREREERAKTARENMLLQESLVRGRPMTAGQAETAEGRKAALEIAKQRLGVERERLKTQQDPTRKLRFPTAVEQEHMTIDSGLLKILRDIRKGYKPGYVGFVSGRVRGIGKKAGSLSREESAFRASVAGLRNQILKARSGAAITPQEAIRLLEEAPTVNDASRDFESKLKAFEDTYRYIANTRRQTMGGSGVDISGVPPLPGGVVRMRNPKDPSKVYEVDEEEKAEAIANGWEVVP